ncbi:hypothetical protein NJB1907f44_02790 [Mycobacterium marinum]|nr:hypothetical protein MMRN_37480 [Mycobacterium marinum]GJO00716.1 hypothetical protein NJB1907E90_03170 [Mycobacterium marinum]GJO08492.1 hypothetical protein NJB1907f34b_36610 [Mycobacterium marinum]GJO13844.1 hypothetical protein NJB1728e18_03230 [Mycobacterium marinum]GJO22577.1 hypothetical protein NJB1907E11_33160 [Mycobacterium marinum]
MFALTWYSARASPQRMRPISPRVGSAPVKDAQGRACLDASAEVALSQDSPAAKGWALEGTATNARAESVTPEAR